MYCSKFDTGVKHMLPVFYTIRKQKRKTKALDAQTNPEREAMFFLTRALNKFASL